jgi:hypothetical protein
LAASLRARGLGALARSPIIGQLARLGLYACEIDDAAIRALAGARAREIAVLELGSNQIGDPGLNALVDGGLLERRTRCLAP